MQAGTVTRWPGPVREAELLERRLAPAREALGPDFEARAGEGSALLLDEAVALALGALRAA